MKLVLVTQSYYPNIGGIEVHVQQLAERLVKMVDLEIYTLDSSAIESRELYVNGIKVRTFKARPIGKEIMLPSAEFKKALEKSDADVIHLHGFHSLLPYYVLKTKFKKAPKLVITTHYHGKGHTFLRNLLFIFYKPILRQIANLADKIICVSSYEKSLILRDFGVENEKIVVLPNGISFEGFDNNNCSIQRQRNKILSVGRLEKYKNFDKVIRAMKLLKSDFTLSIVGNGSEKSRLLELIRKLELEESVSLKSNLSREDLMKEYASSSLFILPSYYESFGIVVAEAQSLGLKVIVSNSGALSEFVDGGYAQGIPSPITAEKIAQTIIQVSRSNVPVNNYKPYTWDAVAEEMTELYKSLI